ncbi:uncharacterized protein LOC143963483 [Lithobates pipiens]
MRMMGRNILLMLRPRTEGEVGAATGGMARAGIEEEVGMKGTEKDDIQWNEENETAFTELKRTLTSTSVLGLPNYEKLFEQTVDSREGHMTSVLPQTHGGKQRPIAYYSTKLDNVTRALPPCVQAVVAAAEAIKASASIVLYHPLILKVPHAVSVILLQQKISHLSPARHLSCITVLLTQSHITIQRCTTLNPSTLLPIPTDGEKHDCTAAIAEKVLPRSDLKDTLLPHSDMTLFVDGSSRKYPDGTNATGYAIVPQIEVLEAEMLPRHYSAQVAELIALTRACTLAEGKKATIYTDSQYAFSTVHVFNQQWKNRGMVTSGGKPISHTDFVLGLLDAIQLPMELAICKCQAHTKGKDPICEGNKKSRQSC